MDLDDTRDLPFSHRFASDNDINRWRKKTAPKRRQAKVYIERGMKRSWSPQEEKAMMVLVMDGYTAEQIAEKLNRTIGSIQGKMVHMKSEAEKAGVDHDWRADMEKRAIPAINAGLDATEDPYKRAAVGIQVLKGLRVMEPDLGVNIAAVIGQIPAEHRARYLGLDEGEDHPNG